MVGARSSTRYWPKRLYNHDAEDPKGMKEVGTTDHGEVVELNRKAVESDLRHLREPEPRAHGRRAQVGDRGAVRLQEPPLPPRAADDAAVPQLHGPEARASCQRA